MNVIQVVPSNLHDAYQYCGQIMKHHSRSYYLGTLAMPGDKRRAIWAVYTWCRSVDDLVDSGKPATEIRNSLKEIEIKLVKVFQNQPTNLPELALADSIQKFALEIQPFQDMIKGQKMDLEKNRYETFEALELYCYRVAGTVGLMSVQILNDVPKGSDEAENADRIEGALALGTANQLTNIIRDVAEDRARDRIYIPLKELQSFDYTEADLFEGVLDERWRALLEFQVQRARHYYQEAEDRLPLLSKDSRRAVRIALSLYRSILDRVEENNYDVFSGRLYVPQYKKISCIVSSHLNWKVPGFRTAKSA